MMRFTKSWCNGRLKDDQGDWCVGVSRQIGGHCRQRAGQVGTAAATVTKQTLSVVTLAGLNWASGLFGVLRFPPGGVWCSDGGL